MVATVATMCGAGEETSWKVKASTAPLQEAGIATLPWASTCRENEALKAALFIWAKCRGGGLEIQVGSANSHAAALSPPTAISLRGCLCAEV